MFVAAFVLSFLPCFVVAQSCTSCAQVAVFGVCSAAFSTCQASATCQTCLGTFISTGSFGAACLSDSTTLALANCVQSACPVCDFTTASATTATAAATTSPNVQTNFTNDPRLVPNACVQPNGFAYPNASNTVAIIFSTADCSDNGGLVPPQVLISTPTSPCRSALIVTPFSLPVAPTELVAYAMCSPDAKNVCLFVSGYSLGTSNASYWCGGIPTQSCADLGPINYLPDSLTQPPVVGACIRVFPQLSVILFCGEDSVSPAYRPLLSVSDPFKNCTGVTKPVRPPSLNATAPVLPPVWTQRFYIKSNWPRERAHFATVRLSADGNTLVVGAHNDATQFVGGINKGLISPEDPNDVTAAGTVAVYSRYSTGEFAQVVYMTPFVPTPVMLFGISVSVSRDGGIVAVGAPGDNTNLTTGKGGDFSNQGAPRSGAMYIYRRLANLQWVLDGYLKHTDAVNFGEVHAMNGPGTLIAVSSRTRSGLDSFQYAVDIFRAESGTWVFEAAIASPDESLASGFGSSVSLSESGSVLAVGADSLNNKTGAAYVYQRVSPGVWSLTGRLSGSLAGDNFGSAVQLSADGRRLLVGANNAASPKTFVPAAGAAYLYELVNQSAWVEVTRFEASNPDTGDAFGSYLSFSPDANQIAISAIYEASGFGGVDANQLDNSAPGAGAVYVFQLNASSSSSSSAAWSFQSYIKHRIAHIDDSFGWNLGFSGNVIAVGAPGESSIASGLNGNENNTQQESSGAAYVFSPFLVSISGSQQQGVIGVDAVVQSANISSSLNVHGDVFAPNSTLSVQGNATLTVDQNLLFHSGDLTLGTNSSLQVGTSLLLGSGAQITVQPNASFQVNQTAFLNGTLVVEVPASSVSSPGTIQIVNVISYGSLGFNTSFQNVSALIVGSSTYCVTASQPVYTDTSVSVLVTFQNCPTASTFSGLSGGQIAGIVIGVVAAGALIGALIGIIALQQRKKRMEAQKMRIKSQSLASVQQQVSGGPVITEDDPDVVDL